MFILIFLIAKGWAINEASVKTNILLHAGETKTSKLIKCSASNMSNELIKQLQMLLFPNALCCSLYERNCVCSLRSHQNFYEIFTRKQFLPTSAGNAQAQLHFCG